MPLDPRRRRAAVTDAVRFPTEDGLTLEGELRAPAGDPLGTAVLCHPHPLYGGSKDHPLLWTIRNELAGRRGLATLCFNFRGIMGSEGSFGRGEDEVLDVSAAVDRVREEAAGPTAVVGWSFGGAVALRHAVRDERVAALVLVALALAPTGIEVPPPPPPWHLERLGTPVLLVAGSADGFCRGPALRSLAERLPHGEVRMVAGADHFFGRREREVAEIVGEFLDRALAPEPAGDQAPP